MMFASFVGSGGIEPTNLPGKNRLLYQLSYDPLFSIANDRVDLEGLEPPTLRVKAGYATVASQILSWVLARVWRARSCVS